MPKPPSPRVLFGASLAAHVARRARKALLFRGTMVACEANILPAPICDESGTLFDSSHFANELDDLLGSRSSRPYYDDGGWAGIDQYSDDLPVEEGLWLGRETHEDK